MAMTLPLVVSLVDLNVSPLIKSMLIKKLELCSLLGRLAQRRAGMTVYVALSLVVHQGWSQKLVLLFLFEDLVFRKDLSFFLRSVFGSLHFVKVVAA
jgi:hypothetical protein